jgi:hypothetical protein
MKLSQLKNIVKEAVKEAIQEEMKEILIEAVRAPKQVVQEVVKTTPQSTTLPETDKLKLRENMMSVLDGMRPNTNGTLNATTNDIPLQVGSGDTTSANGSLPQGNVSMDQIMGLMQSKG